MLLFKQYLWTTYSGASVHELSSFHNSGHKRFGWELNQKQNLGSVLSLSNLVCDQDLGENWVCESMCSLILTTPFSLPILPYILRVSFMVQGNKLKARVCAGMCGEGKYKLGDFAARHSDRWQESTVTVRRNPAKVRALQSPEDRECGSGAQLLILLLMTWVSQKRLNHTQECSSWEKFPSELIKC